MVRNLSNKKSSNQILRWEKYSIQDIRITDRDYKDKIRKIRIPSLCIKFNGSEKPYRDHLDQRGVTKIKSQKRSKNFKYNII